MNACPECSLHEMVSFDQAWQWVGPVRWYEPNWWTRRRIDRAMKIREQMNEAYGEGMCQGLGHPIVRGPVYGGPSNPNLIFREETS